jgi:L-2-hydroxyglutarate oxidase LhgO
MRESGGMDKPARPSYQRCDVAVVGGGIVGLAIARELLRRYPGLRVVVLEKEAALASHQSGHNSGVIHTGIYYAPDSLKARACVVGHREMLAFCREEGIPFERCGKVIIALDEGELPRLEALYRRGVTNGVQGLELIGAERLREIEPHAAGIRAIYSPNTGIVDFGQVAQAYARAVLQRDGEIATGCEVTGFATGDEGVILATRQAAGGAAARGETGELEARYVITCAGLQSDRLSQMTTHHKDAQHTRIVPFRGDYYTLRPEKRHMVRALIYPVPDTRFPFLGVHFTRRLNGDVWAGPNAVLAFAREGYQRWRLDPTDLWNTLSYGGFWRMAATYWKTGLEEMYRDYRKRAYVGVLRRYLPELQEDDLMPGPSGIRAQAVAADGRLVDDFLIARSGRVIHVQNAPSPAATSSLVIARMIVDEAERGFDLAPTTSTQPGSGTGQP